MSLTDNEVHIINMITSISDAVSFLCAQVDKESKETDSLNFRIIALEERVRALSVNSSGEVKNGQGT